MSDLTALSAIELSRTITSGDASCVEVMDAFLETIEALNPQVNALVNVIPRDECLELAREADAAPRIDAGPGWLHGIP
ncbi:MAG: amidase family protein, partial [Proteobacteria bacterium]|nr:amidase family protein [Pseudomonadota bacterium]